MLLAKSCHDIDIMVWMLSETEPMMVSSFGSDFQFGKCRKPENAGSRCMLDCPLNEECVFSAQYNYLEPQRWEQYVWKALEKQSEYWGEAKPLDLEHKEILGHSLKNDNNFGKCVWDFERDGNVDHQCVTVNFKNGATGVFSLIGGTPKSERNIHIIGTKGEIKGEFSTQEYTLRLINPKEETGYTETTYNSQITGDYAGERGEHGGGDVRLIADFCNALETGEKSISCTEIMDSIKSHMIVYKAEESRKNNCIVTL
jgi:predicted dehydrogenase